MNNLVNKYLINNFLKTVGNVVLIFICIGIILNLFGEIEFFKNLDEDLTLPMYLTFLSLPNLIIQLFPFIIFISAMWLFTTIKSNKELITLKVFGYSNLKIILIVSITAFVLGFLILILINPITSAMIKSYEQIKANYSRDVDHLVTINKNGLWIKEKDGKNLRIIKAKKISGNYINNVSIYFLNNENNIIKRIESEKADIRENLWVFEKTTIFNLDNENNIERLDVDDYKITSIYNVEKLTSLYKNLDTLSFIELITEFEKIHDKGYSKESLYTKLNMMLSLPIFLFLMVFLASIFVVGSINKPQNAKYIFISIITCVLIYYLKDLSIALGKSNRIPLMLSVWMPIIAISLFCSAGILQINEK